MSESLQAEASEQIERLQLDLSTEKARYQRECQDLKSQNDKLIATCSKAETQMREMQDHFETELKQREDDLGAMCDHLEDLKSELSAEKQ